MEIILAVVVAAAGLAMVWIALTFRARTERYSAPLISRSEEKVQKWLSQYYRSLEIGAQDGLNRFGGRLTALEKRIADAARRLDQLDGHLGQITRRIAGTESELGALHRQSTENARRHADELRQMRGDLKEAAGSSRETRGALTTLSGELREVQAALAALRQVPGRLNDTSQRVSDLTEKTRAARLRTEVQLATLKNAIDQNALRTDDLLGFRRLAIQQLSGIASDIRRSGRQLDRVHSALRQRLDLEAAMRPGDRSQILSGSIFASRPAATDILPFLYLGLLRALSLKPLLEERGETRTTVYALRSGPADSNSAEQQFGTLLDACTDEDPAAVPGLAEFRSLALGAYSGGPAVLTIGPIALVRTDQALIGCLVTGSSGTLRAEILTAPDACAEQLRQCPGAACRDLAPWAERC